MVSIRCSRHAPQKSMRVSDVTLSPGFSRSGRIVVGGLLIETDDAYRP